MSQAADSLVTAGDGQVAGLPSDAGTEDVGTHVPSSYVVRPAPPPAPFKPSGLWEFQSVYDDNVFRLGEDDLVALRSESTPGNSGIKGSDDFILSPRLTVNVGRQLRGPRATTLRLSQQYWYFSTNRTKSNAQWSLRLRQPIGRTDAIEFDCIYAPSAYIRTLSYLPSGAAPGDPPTSSALRGSRKSFGLAYAGRVSDRWSYRAEVGHALRFYGQPFVAAASHEWSGAGAASVRLPTPWTAAVRYQHALATSAGRDAGPLSGEEADMGDGSYVRDLYQATVGCSPTGGLWMVKRFDLTGQRHSYRYTSERPYAADPAHAGRRDALHVMELKATSEPVLRALTLELGWRHSLSASTWAASVAGANGAAPDRTYSDNRIWFGVGYPF